MLKARTHSPLLKANFFYSFMEKVIVFPLNDKRNNNGHKLPVIKKTNRR